MLIEEALIHYSNNTSPAGNYKWPVLQYNSPGKPALGRATETHLKKERETEKKLQKTVFPLQLMSRRRTILRML